MSKWDIGTSGNLSSNELSPADSQLCGNTIAVNVSPIGVLGDHTNHGEPRYTTSREIGRGGTSSVFLGWDKQLSRPVAVKTLKGPHPAPKNQVRRFFREAEIAGRLQHPTIPNIHEYHSTDGAVFIVMDLLEGMTLREKLLTRPDFATNLPFFLNVFLQICQGIAFAHSRGTVHRDIKPSNIMVGEFGVVTILDWGLAKVLTSAHDISLPESDHQDFVTDADCGEFRSEFRQETDVFETQAGTVFGTPNYFPPEQARGDLAAVDSRSDVFCLGGILCEILTGSPPFCGGTIFDLQKKSANGDLSSAFQLLDECQAPHSLVQIAKTCLAADPTNRPQDGSALLTLLTGYFDAKQRRAEQDLIRFFDMSLDLLGIANLQGCFQSVNRNFSVVLGYTDDEILGKPFYNFVHPEDLKNTIHEIQGVLEGQPTQPFLNRYQHRSGHFLWLEWTFRFVAEERVFFAVANDVNIRVESQHNSTRLHNENDRLAQIVNSTDDAIISRNLKGIVQSWNSGATRIFEYSASEVIGQTLDRLTPVDRIQEERQILAKLRQGIRIENFEAIRVQKSGKMIYVALTISPIYDAAGLVIGDSTIARDITALRRLDREREINRQELLDFVENANVPLHWVDANGIIVWANQAELKFLGYSHDEYIGFPIAKFHANQNTISEILQKLASGQILNHVKADLIARNGSIKSVWVYSSVYCEDGQFKHTRCVSVAVKATP